MKLKNEVFNNKKFNETITTLNETSLPAGLAYKLLNLSKELAQKNEAYNEVKQSILDKYGTLNEKKEQYTFDKKNADKFNEEFNELLQEEFEVAYEPQVLPDDVRLTPAQISSIENLFIF